MSLTDVTPGKNGSQDQFWQPLIELTLSSGPGNEYLAVDQATEAIQKLNWPEARLAHLELVLNKATLKAIERSPLGGLEVLVRVLIPVEVWARQETDSASYKPTQPPSDGWGFFLIERTRSTAGGEVRHLIELYLYLEGEM